MYLHFRNETSVKLATSAPLNNITVPILEMLGILVNAQLMSKVKKIVNLKRIFITITRPTLKLFFSDFKKVQKTAGNNLVPIEFMKLQN